MGHRKDDIDEDIDVLLELAMRNRHSTSGSLGLELGALSFNWREHEASI
jgi:hypothetical protein